MAANVRQAMADYLAAPAYGRQKQLCITYGVARSTLSQAINRALK